METFIWGASAIGKVIDRSEKQVHHMHATGAIPTRKVGGHIVVERSELLAAIRGKRPTKESTHAAE